MALDHYVTLGRSGLRVSPLCLGAMTFGEDLGWGSSVEESQQILDRFIAVGGNFIDTANFYTKGHSVRQIHALVGERRQGRPLGVHGGVSQRDDIHAHRRARDHREGARQHGRAGRASLGADATGCKLDHHRRPPAQPARRQPEVT